MHMNVFVPFFSHQMFVYILYKVEQEKRAVVIRKQKKLVGAWLFYPVVKYNVKFHCYGVNT